MLMVTPSYAAVSPGKAKVSEIVTSSMNTYYNGKFYSLDVQILAH